jgi:P27 family predicted phage terminase small subunit
LKRPTKIAPPNHLRPETKSWWLNVLEEYELEPHHVRLLTLACESWDRATLAREAIAEHGLTYTDRFSSPRKRPEVSIAESATIAFARLTRELDLDCGSPATAPPPPALNSNRRH